MDALSVRQTVPASQKGPLAGRRLLIIQDVHMNPEAQKNVAKALTTLIENGRAGLVAVEGAVGPFDLPRYRAFSDSAVTRDVAADMFAAGRMGGPSFAGLTAVAEPPAFVGIDDETHYEANVAAYLRGASGKAAVVDRLAVEEQSIASRVRTDFSGKLAGFHSSAVAYTRGEKSLGDFLVHLDGMGLVTSPNAKKFLDAWKIERRLDLPRAEAERRAALEKLVARLSPAEIESILALSVSYKSGALGFGTYHARIARLLADHGVSLEGLPSFRDYLRYVALSDGINADRLLEETQRITETAFAALATTKAAKKLVAESRRHELRRKLVEFSLTPHEWTEYARTPDASLSSFEDFYREAHVRSEKMVENLVAASASADRSKIVVLVIGGFHAPEMAEALRGLGAGYILTAPKLTRVDLASGSAYLSVFGREKTPLDRIFAGERLFILPGEQNVTAVGPRTVAVNRELAAMQAATAAVRDGKEIVQQDVDGNPVTALGGDARSPFGYDVVSDRRIGSTRIRILSASAWRSALTRFFRAPSRLIGSAWDRATDAGLMSRQTAARLSFLEELLFTGVIVLAVPYLLATFGGVPASVIDIIRPILVLMSAGFFAARHESVQVWTADGRVVSTGESGSGAAFVLGIVFRAAAFHPAASTLLILGAAALSHLLWSGVLARLVPGLPIAMMSARAMDRDVPSASETNWIAENAPLVAGKNIVEVTMEMALTGEAFKALEDKGFDLSSQIKAAMATSTGGIGPLLKERVIALGNLGANVTGVSLLYEHVWIQKVVKGTNGAPDEVELEKVEIGSAFRAILEPVEPITVEMWDGSVVTAKVWKAPAGMYGRSEQYFIDYPPVTDTVYPGKADVQDSDVLRLSQNWLVGRGTLQLLKQLDRKPDITVMSEMPSTLAQHRLVEDKYTNDPFFKDTMYVFNDHTPLEYAHPQYDQSFRGRMRLREIFWKNLPVMHGDRVDGTAMIISMMQKVGGVFAVAAKHARVMKAMEALRIFAEKIFHVTNGVSESYWPTDEFTDPAAAQALSDEAITGVKDRRRAELFRYIAKRQGLGDEWADEMIAGKHPVGVWTRRIVEYKRMNIFADLLESPEKREAFLKTGIVFIIGGRIHQDDPYGRIQYARIMKVLSENPELKKRFVFFENYSIREAPVLFRGADFSVMGADDGQEASATGFQKMQMNGGAVIASHDGAVPESVIDPAESPEDFNGFLIPYEEVEAGKRLRPTAAGLLSGFERFADVYRDQTRRARMIRNALKAAPRVSVVRAAKDMLKLFQKGLEFRQAKSRSVEQGRELARAVFDATGPQPADAAGTVAVLDQAPTFGWKYKQAGVLEVQLHESAAGLANFLEAFRMMDQDLGTAGEWSLMFHMANNNGRGDVIAYLEAAFRASPELSPFLVALQAIGEKARRADDAEARIAASRTAVGFAEEVLALMRERSLATPVAPSPVAAGDVARILERQGYLPESHDPDPDWILNNAPAVAGKRIVEVTMEMALSPAAFDAMERIGIPMDERVKAAMATSTGGIGPLLKERVIALGDLGADVVGVSLLYDNVWVQKIRKGVNGAPDVLELEKQPIGDAFRKILEPDGTMELQMPDGSFITAKIWKAPAGMYGRSTQYFIDFPPITDVVYPGKADVVGSEFLRLSQNWLIGRGTLKLLKERNLKPSITIMSEMPSTLALHRLVDDTDFREDNRFSEDPFFEDNHYVLNDHTPLEYAHPKWDEGIRKRMRIRDIFWKNLNVEKGGQVDGTAMLVGASDQVYGVAEKHARVMRAMEALRQFASKITYVTNGVSSLYRARDSISDPATIDGVADDEVTAAKDRRRAELFRYIAKRQGLGDEWADEMIAGKHPVGVWTRRIVEYKRMNIFADLLESPEKREAFLKTGIVFIIGGRIHQDDPYGRIQYARIMKVLSENPELKKRFVFFDNYNILEAPTLFQGADFSVMGADDGQEASATGFQKMQMNGGAVIASHDGAVPESVIDPAEDADNFNGFIIPYEEVVAGERMRPTAAGLLGGFQRFAEVYGDKTRRARMIRNAVKASPRVDVMRTAKDMLLLLDQGMKERKAKADLAEAGAETAREFFRGASISPDEASRILDQLEKAGSFDWKYKAGAVEERLLIRTDGGFARFLEDYRRLEGIGTGGYWSLLFHGANRQGGNDVILHLVAGLATVPALAPLREKLEALAARSFSAASNEERVALTRTAMGVAIEVHRALRGIAAGSRRHARLERFQRISGGIAFDDESLRVRATDADRIEVTFSVRLDGPAADETQLFIHYGRLDEEWASIPVLPTDITRDADGRIYVKKVIVTGEVGIYRPGEPGSYGLTAYAAPKGVSDVDMRVWIAPGRQVRFDRVQNRFGRQASYHNEVHGDGVPLGLIGLWSGARGLSFRKATLVESVTIALSATIALIVVFQEGLVVFSGSSVLDVLQLLLRLSLTTLAASLPILVLVHLIFGVMQPTRSKTPVFRVALAFGAGLVAAFSLLGLPLIAFSILSSQVGANVSIFVVGLVVLVAVGLGAMAHDYMNEQLLKSFGKTSLAPERRIQLSVRNRDRIVSAASVLARFLAVRDAVSAGPELDDVRERRTKNVPEELVQPMPTDLENLKIDVLVVLGSHFLEVPENAARAYYRLRAANPDLVVAFAGGIGPRTSLRLPHWSSEAELFQDIFREQIRALWRSELEDKLRSSLKGFGGAYTGLIVGIALFFDHLLRGYRKAMPKTVIIDTESTNTGENIRNLTQLFSTRGFTPESVMLITADVFELRSSRSWLQQYPFPMKTLYSMAANTTAVSEMSDPDLVDLADTMLGELDRLEDYAKDEKRFMLPAPAPSSVLTARDTLRATLSEARLSGFSKAPFVGPKKRVPSVLKNFLVFFVLGSMVALIPLGNNFAVADIFLSILSTMAALASAGLLALATYILAFAPAGVRASERIPNTIGRGVVWILQLVIPVSILVLGSLDFVTGDVSRIIWLALGVVSGIVVHLWMVSSDRKAAISSDVPGAAGFWGRTGLPLSVAGFVEGFAAFFVAGAAMFTVSLLPMDVASPLAIWAFLSATGSVAAGAFLAIIHMVSGVTVAAGTPPDRDPRIVAAAIRTSFVSLLGVPLIAAAFVLPAFPAVIALVLGFTLATVPHAAKNGRVDRAQALLSREQRAEAASLGRALRAYRDAARRGDRADIARALADLVALEDLGLDAFGRDIESLALANPGVLADWAFFRSGAAHRAGDLRESTLSDAIASDGFPNETDEARRRNHLGVLLIGSTADELIADARRAVNVAEGRTLKLILPSVDAGVADAVRAALNGQATVLSEGDLSTPEAVRENLLEPALKDAGTLKMLIRREAGLPEFVTRALLDAVRQDERYRGLLEFVVVTALSGSAFAIRASIQDVESAIEFRRLVLTQA